MSVAETERWLAPVLNYIPARATKDETTFAATPANDVASTDLASHPAGCTCAVHLVWRKKKVGAG
jgi:5-methyltetrahydrofolate--homocysteine methyltransferase